MGEEVDSVSPTLGFIIKTIEYEGYMRRQILISANMTKLSTEHL